MLQLKKRERGGHGDTGTLEQFIREHGSSQSGVALIYDSDDVTLMNCNDMCSFQDSACSGRTDPSEPTCFGAPNGACHLYGSLERCNTACLLKGLDCNESLYAHADPLLKTGVCVPGASCCADTPCKYEDNCYSNYHRYSSASRILFQITVG